MNPSPQRPNHLAASITAPAFRAYAVLRSFRSLVLLWCLGFGAWDFEPVKPL
jgi:hypothetical protein